VLKKLAEVVNVVPVIAKADSLTLEEREVFKQRVSGRGDVAKTRTPLSPSTHAFPLPFPTFRVPLLSNHTPLHPPQFTPAHCGKASPPIPQTSASPFPRGIERQRPASVPLTHPQVMSEMLHNQIRLYPFDSEDNDEEELQLNERIREMLPFAVVGSERTVVIDGKPVRGRKNRWGVINCEDERHCEFVYLRNFLTRWVGRALAVLHRFSTLPSKPYPYIVISFLFLIPLPNIP
jgi:hypothetical protein